MYNSFYDKLPEVYSPLRKGWMFDEKYKILSKFIIDNKLMSILEFGCGTGDILSRISNDLSISSVGYDINADYIHYNRSQYENIEFTNNFSELLEGKFDIIYINDVIHHFPQEMDFLKKIQSLSYKYLFVLEPNQFNPYICYFQYKTNGERNFIQRNFENNLKEMGLIILKKEYKFIFPNSIKKLNQIGEFLNGVFENNLILGGSVLYIIKNNHYHD